MADDDADDRYLALFAFNSLKVDHRLDFVADGAELMTHLLSKVNSPSELPDLILLDLNMPRKNGREALIEIKSHPKLKDLDIIVYSTSHLEKDRQDCINLGAASYIVKPIGLEKLVEVFKKISNQLSAKEESTITKSI
jgi:CheY-like chemotaxis protein